jgi:nitroreductase
MSDENERILAERYGGSDHPKAEPWSDTIGVIAAHRSVRKFAERPLPPNTLDILVACAQSAATSSNLQSWSVVAVTEPELKAELSKVADNQAPVVSCPLFLVWVADLSRAAAIAEAQCRDSTILPFLDTLFVAFVDAAIAAQTAVIAAESLGLSTVYVGGVRNDSERVCELLDLPAYATPVSGLCIGYAAAAGKVKPRLPQAAILHHQRYHADAWRPFVGAYDEAMRAFSTATARPPQSWTERVTQILNALKSPQEHNRLRAALERSRFTLR